jgi:PTH1 family peptidyl-tRNA hydrolase
VKLFAGLGNPGAQYALHRHNIGFMTVDAIAALYGFGAWKTRFQGLASEGRIGDHKVTLLKPATFMNDSGRSVGEALRFFKLDPATALTVFYDELDLEPMKLRVKHVLGNFAKAEMEPLADLLGAVAAEVPWLLAGDEARFMNEVARRTVPQR